VADRTLADNAGRGAGSGPGQGLVRETARGLLVTPWFAAGTGFVIAAGMWIYAPHASLLISSKPFESACKVLGCGPEGGGSGLGHGSQPGGTSGKSTSGTSTGGQSLAASGLAFSYHVLWHEQGKFGALIMITGRHAIEHWRLSFEMPGTQISAVDGGSWQPEARGAGAIVSGYGWQDAYVGRHSADGPGGGFDQRDAGPGMSSNDPFGGGGPRGRQHELRILVQGQGSPSWPVNCSYNGASCTFGS
jgi:hypothetical protein